MAPKHRDQARLSGERSHQNRGRVPRKESGIRRGHAEQERRLRACRFHTTDGGINDAPLGDQLPRGVRHQNKARGKCAGQRCRQQHDGRSKPHRRRRGAQRETRCTRHVRQRDHEIDPESNDSAADPGERHVEQRFGEHAGQGFEAEPGTHVMDPDEPACGHDASHLRGGDQAVADFVGWGHPHHI